MSRASDSIVILTVEDLDSYGFAQMASEAESLFAPRPVRCSDPTDIRRLDAAGAAVALAAVQVALQAVSFWLQLKEQRREDSKLREELNELKTKLEVDLTISPDGQRLTVSTGNYVVHAENLDEVVLIRGQATETIGKSRP